MIANIHHILYFLSLQGGEPTAASNKKSIQCKYVNNVSLYFTGFSCCGWKWIET